MIIFTCQFLWGMTAVLGKKEKNFYYVKDH